MCKSSRNGSLSGVQHQYDCGVGTSGLRVQGGVTVTKGAVRKTNLKDATPSHCKGRSQTRNRCETVTTTHHVHDVLPDSVHFYIHIIPLHWVMPSKLPRCKQIIYVLFQLTCHSESPCSPHAIYVHVVSWYL